MAGRSRAEEVLHCGGMVAFAAAAHAAPVATLLASYAVLGPLHYLTETSWLHDRGYGIAPRRTPRAWLPATAALVALAAIAVAAILLGRPVVAGASAVAALVLAVAARLTPRAWPLVAAPAALALLVLSPSIPPGPLMAALLLPNVVHIFLFTPLFMLGGLVRSPDRAGAGAMALWAACAASFAVLPTAAPDPLGPLAFFQGDVAGLAAMIGSGPGTRAVLGFAAFGYGYHYLSWFSAAGVTGWHRASPRRTLTVASLWAVCLLAYADDYVLGLLLTLPLSVAHEFLELPTNVSTIAHLASAVRRLPRRLVPARAVA